MAELAKLIESLFDDEDDDVTTDHTFDPSVSKTGFEQFYSVLETGIRKGNDGELGFQDWELDVVQAVGSVAYAVAYTARSVSVLETGIKKDWNGQLRFYSAAGSISYVGAHAAPSVSVENADTIVVSVVQKSVEFAICYLEKTVATADDFGIQNRMVQLLEVAMFERMDKDLDLPRPSFLDCNIDLMRAFASGNSIIDLSDHVKCMLQGGVCSKEEKSADRFLISLASECVQPVTMTQHGESISYEDVHKSVTLFRHWAVAHLKCVHRLISLCKELIKLSHIVDEKMVGSNCCKRLSLCLKIFRLLKLLVKNVSFVEFDADLVLAIVSFCETVPNLFGAEFEFGNYDLNSDPSPESLALLLLEEFLILMQVINCNTSVVQNIRACIIASILGNLNKDVCSYNSSGPNQWLPLAYFPRVLCYMLKLIMVNQQWREQVIGWEEFSAECSENCSETENYLPTCHVGSEKIMLLRKYKEGDLLEIVFRSSQQWLDHLMHVLLFLHSEGIKLKPKLERSYSIGAKVASSTEQELAICAEEEALFGDLFSEGGRSAGVADGYDQPIAAVGSISKFCNMPMQAATELLGFLKTCVFSPDWQPIIYDDSCRKLTKSHIQVLLFLLSSSFTCSEDSTTSEIGTTSHEPSKSGDIQELGFDLLHNLLLRRILSVPLEEFLVEEILKVENDTFVYNDQTLTLLGYAFICRPGLPGSQLRHKAFQLYVEFIKQKAKTVCSSCLNLKELVHMLPSTYHIEILLLAFHLSSDSEKAKLSNMIFLSLGEVVAACPTCLNATQLSCWALTVSRLVLVLRHMIYYPRTCPPSFLLELKSKLRKCQMTRLCASNDVKSHLSSWLSVVVGNLMSTGAKEWPLCDELLDQFLDIAPVPASVRGNFLNDCLSFSGDDLCATLSQILVLWKGKIAATVDDLIVERYMFVLCWDIPATGSGEYALHFWTNMHGLDALDMRQFLCFSHSLLDNCCFTSDNFNFPETFFAVLQYFQALQMSVDEREPGWDFQRNGSWLSLLVSLLSAGISKYYMRKSIKLSDSVLSEQHTSRDSSFLSLAEGLISWVFNSKQVPLLLRIMSSLLIEYRRFYQRTYLSSLNNGQGSRDLPLLLLKCTGFDRSMQDELIQKAGISTIQLESVCGLLRNLDVTIASLSSASRSKVFWEFVLHGFPSHFQSPNGGLISCLLSIKDIVSFLDKLLTIKDADEIRKIDTDVIGQILDSIMAIKCDKIFACVQGKCESVYHSLTGLTDGMNGPDYSCLFVLKQLENSLREIKNREECQSSIHEGIVCKYIDSLEILRKDPSKVAVFRVFLCSEDVSAQVKDLYASKRGDILVLFDSLDSCNSDLVNVKVLNFIVELISGESCPGVKQKIQERLVGMDLLSLSKWLERRLLGILGEVLGEASCTKGISVPLRESTMNFIVTLLSSVSEPRSRELHSHLFAALLLSLDTAFMLFETHTAKSYFSFVVQLARDETSMKSLLQQSLILMKRLSGNEHLLQGLKYLFGFLVTILNDCGSNKPPSEKSFGRSSSGNSSNVGLMASRSLSSRKNSESFVLSASQEAGSTSLECDATSADEDEDDGTSDGEVGSLDKDDEDDSNCERSLASKVCTFTSSGSNFMEQHWYFCYTCDLTVSKGCCSVCAKVCHRGHRVVYSRSSRFFCDCGAGGVRGSSCQCLKPRKFIPNSAPSRGAANFQSFLPFTDDGDQLQDSDSDVDEDGAVDSDNSIRLAISREIQDKMPLLLTELDVEDQVLEICTLMLPCITARRSSCLSKDKRIVLGEDKVLSYSVDLLQLRKAYKSGSLDLKIKADYSNAKELKSHLASGSLAKSLLSVSSRGRLAVGEGDKVAIFDVGQLIGQATASPVTADKANVKPLSKNVVRFEIVHLIFNPVVESYLAVAGFEDCQVLTVSHRGEVTDRLAIELALQGAYIRCVEWVPGSQVQLMVVTNKFVKIYDLSQDNISPVHYFTLPNDMIVDATLVSIQGRMFLVVLSELGCLFRFEISTKGNVGARPLTESIQIPDREVSVKGLSLYFSSTYKLLYVSYQDGTTLIGRLRPDTTSFIEVSSVYEDEHDGKLRSAGMHRWKELFSGSGLFVCFSTVKSNASFAVSMGEHEIFAQSLRHSVGSTSPLVGVTAYKPLSKDRIHCLVLHDDGSLQIYSYIPIGVDASAMSEKVKRLGSGILNNKAFAASNAEFPLDFFEKTICITADVKLGGDAIRNGDSEGAKQSLTAEDGFLESPSPAGFKVTVSNSNPDMVMVGFRVHVGNSSAVHIPSNITIFHRVIKLDEGMRSWYDVPFSVAESLLADEEFAISIGPSFSGSTLSRIDSLEVYGRAKDEFGWKEKMEAVLNMEARVLGCNSPAAGIGKKHHIEQTAPIWEQVVADGLKVLSRFYSLCKLQGGSKVYDVKLDLSEFKCKQLVETIFESDKEPLLQAAACCVLQAVFPKRDTYLQVKDTMRLLGVVKSTALLSSRLGIGGTAAGWIIEEFTAQMRAVSKIALHRRANLATFLETNGSEVVDGLMQVLWGVLDIEQPDTQTMNNIVISSVELIYCYAECLALHGKGTTGHSVAPAVSLFKQLLFCSNEAVQTASSLAISSRLLQVPFPKQTMLGNDDMVDNSTPIPTSADVAIIAGGNSQITVEEDSITSSVQYCCDGCSTVPILARRWHCTVCPDFDLCEACYEVLDADQLPPPHSRDHPMSAMPIEAEILGGDNESHFSTHDLNNSSLLPEATEKSNPNSTSSIHVLESNESGEFSTSMTDPVTISASKRAVNSLLLSEFLDQLKGWMEVTSGVQAIPVMQLFYRLSSALGGPFVDSSVPDSLDLEKLVRWFMEEINLTKPFTAKTRSSLGEVAIVVFMFFTLMLRNWHQPGTDVSVSKSINTPDKHEKSTSQNASSTSFAHSSAFDDQKKKDFASQLHRACGSLRQQNFVSYIMDILQQLMHVFKSQNINFDNGLGSSPGTGCGALLVVRRELPAGNFSPYFSDSYAKSHRFDIFADYHRLLLENGFRLVYSLVRPEKHDKTGEKEKGHRISSGKELKLDGYQDVLCSYINNPNTTFVRRYARRLFLHLCGSKTHYYSVRDTWQFSSEVKKLYKYKNKSDGFQNNIPYERSVKILKCLSTVSEVAAARPRNWQKYCLRHGDVLPFLMEGLFCFGEESVIQTLKLLNLAFYTGKDTIHYLQKSEGIDTGTSLSKSGTQSLESKKKKGEDGTESGADKSYLDMEPLIEIFTGKGGDILGQFIDCFLLEWNSSCVRAETKCVLFGIWHHGKQSFKETLLVALLRKVRSLPMYGQNIVEYTELVTCFLGRIPDNVPKHQRAEILDRCLSPDVIACIFETLHSQNELLANHPNSRIYNVLSSVVEFDGYYLESEPCVACSMPEVSYSRMKLETLKSETKFTDNRIIVKCSGSYTIQSVTMNVHDARKSKSVKILNLYYNNRPVTDLSELKNNWSLWKRAKSCHLAFNQTELKVDFPIPITACNFMIELDSFYENLQALSLEPLQCPRCSRPVTDKHGICSNCHENAYQCRQCRNINYENLDSFLCNECGYSKYGRFEFNFMAKPSFTFDRMENDDDMKRGLAAIESESENAHRRYQQLLGFKKPLLKIVSSIGENDMDSQQKDSVQQMMVSLPGPSCKINRKIALLGVLYGEKCKAAFDSVSKSVQTLQGLKRVLMNFLHQKISDNSGISSRFMVTRTPSSCYGCASTFVTQCLEILQVLSKHLNSKKQLVSAGILSELFENDIHQGPKTARVQSRAALCAFSEGDMGAVAELNSLIQKKVMYCLEHHRSMDIAVSSREELLLLSEVCALADEFWESRLRVVFQLLFSSIKLGAKHPAISEHIILPCLRIISQACTPPKPEITDKEQGKGKPTSVDNTTPSNTLSTVNKPVRETFDKSKDGPQKTRDIQLLSYHEWEKGASYLDFVRRQYKVDQVVKGGQRSRPQRFDYLAMKYALRWKRRACKANGGLASFELGSWVTELVLSACSQSIRSEMCMLITLLCGQSSTRRFRLLNLLMSFLPATLAAGENASEYFEMLFKMIDSEDALLFLTVRGCLSTLSKLISQEVGKIESLERSLHIDISQGFILHKLIELLGKFLGVPNIRSRFMQEKLLSEVLEAFFIIRGLIVQKTKLINDCNKLLKDLIDSLLLESNENKRQFIQACINGLQIHGEKRKGRTSLFILEQLCNLISPSKPEPVYLLVLNKAHTQEEFIRGSMTKNPYSNAEIGPLMRDVKNKICHQLDLLGLVEDDYGMELLVAGNIISLDLSISQVYELVWRKANSNLLSSSGRDSPPMTVTYRLQGLDGEATEPMIKELEEDREESQDPEVEFAIAGAVNDYGGLEIILSMVQRLREDLKSNQEQLVHVLNLLMLCCKIRDNRRALLRLGALNVLLETARHAFSVDAMEPAEGILLIVESLTLEANESDNIDITQSVLTVSKEKTGSGEQAKKIVVMFLERLCHPSGLKKSNKQQRNNEMVARILPYLTYGEPAAMEALVQHFYTYLQNWGEFDQLQKQYEENPKDDSLAHNAMKQRFAVENFVRVSESLKTSSCGERLKDIILEKGITRVAVGHLRESFAFIGQTGFKSSAEWALYLKLPSVPLILSMLSGLSMGHLATQKCIDEGGILPLLHALEGVAGENEIGARAENLLDTLSDEEGKGDGFLALKIHGLRHATRDEMRRRALKKREQLLQGLGMRQEVASDGGERIVLSRPVFEGLEDVEEEKDGLACMVCREGYSLRPTDLLGVYSYSKRVNLGVGTSGSARGECVYTTVSHFNIIHFQCHQEAKRADAALKNPKKEWEGAALRNSATLCNNLFPLRGPSVPVPQYVRHVDLYWDTLNALGRADGSRIRLLTYDIVLMLARFATGASFSQDSKGGGKESNSHFLPFMVQMACHLLDHGNSSQRRTISKSVSSYLTFSDSKSSSPSATQTEETVQFMMVSSLLSESYESWLQHRKAFLQKGIYHAYMQHTHGRSNYRSSSLSSPGKEPGKNDDLLPIIQPMLVYTGLIEQLQCFFKVKKSTNVGLVAKVGESGTLEGWEVVMKDKLLNVKEMVGFSKEFLSLLEEVTSATSFQESFDIIGVLADVLSGGSSQCEDFVYAAINSGDKPRT